MRDLTVDDLRQFLSQRHRLVAIAQMGPGDSADAFAERQTQQLIESNEKFARLG